MKKFLLRALGFTLPLCLVMFFGDRFLTSALKKSGKGDLGAWNELYKGDIRSDLVIYGASRALVHFDPEILSDSLGMTVYNLGMNGHNFWLEYLRHRVLLEHNQTPKIIVLSPDPFTLYKRPDLYDPIQFLPYLREPQMRAYTSSYEGYDYFDYRVPLLRYYAKPKALFQAAALTFFPGRLKPTRRRGYEPSDLQWTGDLEKAKRAGMQTRIALDSASVRLFYSWLDECRSLGIKVIFVTTPEYVEGRSLIVNRDEIRALYRDAATARGIPFLEYTDDSISNNRRYFYNSQHLNRTGAELFSRRVAHDLKVLLR